MIHYVKVAVALSRPPKIDEWRRYCVVAATRQEAELIAQQMAACTSVMPVESAWESSHRAGPTQPFGALGCMCWNVAWADDVGDDEQWQIHGRCPYHSDCGPTEPSECPPGVHSAFDFCPGRAICEDGWEEPVDHGIRSAECEAGTCDCDGFIPPTADRLMEVQGVMGSIAGCPACAEHGECLDCQEARENPPTPETANAGGPDTDDTTATTSLPYVGLRKVTLKVCPCGDISHAPDACGYAPGAADRVAALSDGRLYATGAMVPDDLKRRVDTVKVSSCTCEQVDVTVYADGPHRQYTRGQTDRDCPLHGDLAQIRAFGHIDVGDRLRVNSFGIWSIDRYNHFTNTVKPGLLSPTLSPGKIECVLCNDWSYSYGTAPGSSATALAAYMTHRTTVTESGLTECRSLSQPRRRTPWQILKEWWGPLHFHPWF